MAKLQPVRGTRDILGDDARRFRRVTNAFRATAGRYGFQEISTPIFEFSEVFQRTLGEASDVVSKEMYTFEDKGGESITLRPEITAGIARAYLSEGLQQHGTVKLFAYGPMFRYERPQKGRYRQFHQIDAEIIGAAEPLADVELISMGNELLSDLGVTDGLTLHINSLGDMESRAAYRDALVDYFSGHKDNLSEDSQHRLSKNPLRILDSKDEGDRALLPDAPRMSDYMNQASADFFKAVQDGLTTLGIDFVHDENLVRGLDYYCHTTFEFITDRLGTQGAVLAGGRYDGLIEQMGGPSTPGAGWAAGIERIAMLLDEGGEGQRPVAIIPMGEAAEKKALKIARNMRRAGFYVEMAYRGNMKKRMNWANKANAHYAVILGEDEIAKGEVQIKDLDSGQQNTIPEDAVLTAIPQEP